MLLLIAVANQVSPQEISDSVYNQRLFYLCKTWGHAKYYHTRIAAGLVNWDNELLKAASGAKNAPTDAAFNDSLLVMLNNAGPMGTSTVPLPVVPDSLNNNNDLGWLQDPFLSSSVRAVLNDIKTKFRPQSNVYVDEVFSNGNPLFDYDSMFYSESDYPSEVKRILAMFRYWNQVHYFFPYKKIMDQNWDTTLVEFIPQVVEAEDALSFNLAFREFTTRINDGHGFYHSPTFNSWQGIASPPFLARFIENEMVIIKVLPEITAVAVGDIIKAIDGSNIYELRANLRKYAHGSNESGIDKNLNDIILLGNSGDFEITVENTSGTHSATLNRNSTNLSALNVNNSPIWKDTLINNCTFGIVDMGRLETTQIADMYADLGTKDAIIFDIRNYPQGTLWTLVNYLFPAPIHIANFTTPDITYPGRLFWYPITIGTGTASPYSGKVILLFDERTLSQAEYTCMGLGQFPGSIKIGSTTAAADGNNSRVYLTGKIYTNFTGLGTYYPDYTPTQRVGIIPDYEVHPTIAGTRAGIDEVLAFALDCSLLNSFYCTSSGCNTNTEWIQQFILGSYTNNSGDDIGYGDFTGNPITVESGMSYGLGITPGFSGSSRREWCRVWIDYNMDGDFTDSGEQVFAANRIKAPVSGNINIPAGISGETRMRVSLKYNAIPSSCENFNYGEVEDYTLDIIAPPPPVANFTGTPTEISTGESVQFTDLSSNNPTSWLWTFEGGTPATSTLQNPVIIYNTAGSFDVTLVVTNGGGSGTLTIPDYITVTQGSGCPDNYEPNETMVTAASITVNTDVTARIGTSTDLDWFKFNNTGSKKKIKITLTNLPANYDVALYKSDGTQVGISRNPGMLDETIIYNTNSVGTYYVKVYGADGAYDPLVCYTLKAAISSSNKKSMDAEDAISEEAVVMIVYPNPARDLLNIDLTSATSTKASLKLISANGQVVISREYNAEKGSNHYVLNLRGLSNGLYVIHLTTDDQVGIQKVLISK